MPRAETAPGAAMPLRDHFHYPANKHARWDKVHGMWPGEITRALNRVLPPRYSAGPLIHIGSLLEIDIAAVEEGADLDAAAEAGQGGGVATAPAVWAPPVATLTVPADWSAVD